MELGVIMTRKPPEDHERIKKDIEQKGIHCSLQWHADMEHNSNDPFYVLKVIFQPDFEHLIKPHAVKAKESLSSGFHISLGHRSAFHDNRGLLRELKGIYNKFKSAREVYLKHVSVADSSVINIQPNDELYKELSNVVYHGTWKHQPHISMD